jgi:uncharacterized protein
VTCFPLCQTRGVRHYRGSSMILELTSFDLYLYQWERMSIAMTVESELPFWRRKTLDEMSSAEWESLCDGCGRCCLVKLEDEDTGQILHTDVACSLFDAGGCRCSDYTNRSRRMPDCVTLTPEAVRTLRWLPPTCAYRMLAEGMDLAAWHPLVSGDPQTVVAAGVSVRGRVHAREDGLSISAMKRRIRKWPGAIPPEVCNFK